MSLAGHRAAGGVQLQDDRLDHLVLGGLAQVGDHLLDDTRFGPHEPLLGGVRDDPPDGDHEDFFIRLALEGGLQERVRLTREELDPRRDAAACQHQNGCQNDPHGLAHEFHLYEQQVGRFQNVPDFGSFLVGSRQERRPGVAAEIAQHVQGNLQPGHAIGSRDSGVHGEHLDLELAGGFDFPLFHQIENPHAGLRRHVGESEHPAHASQGEGSEQRAGGADQDAEILAHGVDDLAQEAHIAGAVLDPDDVGVLREFCHQADADADVRELGHIVDQDGDVALVGDGRVVLQESGFVHAAAVIERRHHQGGVGAEPGARVGELDGLPGRLAARPGDDFFAGGRGLDHGLDDLQFFLVVQVDVLTVRTEGHVARKPGLVPLFDVGGKLVVSYFPVDERGCYGWKDSMQIRRIHCRLLLRLMNSRFLDYSLRLNPVDGVLIAHAKQDVTHDWSRPEGMSRRFKAFPGNKEAWGVV